MSENPWGRIDADGTVYVKLPDGQEKSVGQWAAGDPAEGLKYYQRRYLDIVVEGDLAIKRIKTGQGTPEQALATATRLRAGITDPSGVGDLSVLSDKADQLEAAAEVAKTKQAEKKAAAKAKALAQREELVAKAEKIKSRTQWKQTGQQFREIVEEWKQIPRFDRKAEQELWERFRTARSEFDKRRNEYFAELDEHRAEGTRIKEMIVRKAEGLANSTDWGTTSRAYRDLMAEWKKSPRAGKELDDILWQRFRAAQDIFFTARDKAQSARSEEELANLKLKSDLVAKAEEIDASDHKAARKQFREVLTGWDEIGHVPKVDRNKLERRLRTVEKKITQSEGAHWKKTNPEAQHRAQSTVDSFTEKINKLTKQKDQAEAAGDTKKAADLAQSIATTEMLRTAAQGALADYS